LYSRTIEGAQNGGDKYNVIGCTRQSTAKRWMAVSSLLEFGMFAGGGSKQQQQWQQLGDLLGELVAAFRWERSW
jgi:hypothetical protein